MKKQNNRSERVNVEPLDGFDSLFAEDSDIAEEMGVWAEPQLYLLPLCVPQDRKAERFRSIKISETVKVDNQITTRSFRVNPDPELGLPGSFELEVMTGLYRLADIQMSKLGSVPEYVEMGSFSSFLQLLGKPYSGRYVKMVREALKRLMSTVCISEGFFYSKPRDLYIAESFTFISSFEIAGETDFSGTRYEKTRIKLHEFIRENLNANFRTLIDFDYLRQLRTDIAKPLSLHIAYRVFKEKKGSWEGDYEWLAARLALKVQPDTKRAKDQLKAALNELQTTGFLASYEWCADRKIRFVAGERLLNMHKRRVAAKDAWLLHQREQMRIGQSIKNAPVRTVRELARQESFDPLAVLCTEFAVRGWMAVAAKASVRGLDELGLRAEAVKRGHFFANSLD